MYSRDLLFVVEEVHKLDCKVELQEKFDFDDILLVPLVFYFQLLIAA